MPYVGGGGELQGLGIMSGNRSPFQLGALAGSDPAISQAIRAIESITGIDTGTTYVNGVYGGGDPTRFGMPANPSVDEVNAVKLQIVNIANREPNAIVQGLTTPNPFVRQMAMNAIVANFDNGSGGQGQGYAIYKTQPANMQAAIKAAWFAANGGNTLGTQQAWVRLVEGPEWMARVNRALGSTPGRAVDADGNVWTDGVGGGQNLGNLHDPNFSAWADTVSNEPVPVEPSTGRQNAPTWIPAGSTTPGPVPISFPKSTVPPVTPADVKKGVEEATGQAGNIPRTDGDGTAPTSGGALFPEGAGGATTGGGSYLPGGETAVPTGGTKPVNMAPSGLDALTSNQKTLALVGAGVLAFLMLRRKGS